MYKNRPAKISFVFSLLRYLGAIISLFRYSCFSQIDTLVSDQLLNVNQCIYSTSGIYSLCYQTDAHLVGYDCKGAPFWSNSPYGYSPQYCIMQSDGNFCCYDINHSPKWCSNTYKVGVAPYRLVMQSDRNIVLYDGTNRAIWYSSTSISGTSIVCPPKSPTLLPSPAAPLSGLQLYYRFDSVSGLSVGNIASGSVVYDATLQNGAVVSDSQLTLSAANSQYMKLGSITTGTAGLTFASWWKSDTSGNWARIFELANGASSDNVFIARDTNGFLSMGVWISNQQNDFPTSFKFNNQNAWNHVAWTLDPSGSLSTYTVYVNGVQVISATSKPYPRAITRSSNFLGKSNFGQDAYLNGGVKDFRMYSRVLSATEVGALFTTLQPTQITTISPTQITTVGPTLQPTTGPTVVPFVPLFSTALLSFTGSNFNLYASLPQALNNSFTVSLWLTELSPFPVSLVSLGRSAAYPDSGQFSIEIDKNGHIHFWDSSLATGRGFSALSGNLIVKGSRTHVAVSRSGLGCTIYINGQFSVHSTAAASVVYRNSDLVFGANHVNNSDYFSGSMDHVAIYSHSFKDANVAAVYAAELASVASSPTAIPSSRGDSSSSSSSSQGDSGGCDKYCMIGIIVGIVGAVGSFCGICAAYHIFCMMQQRTQNCGNNFHAVATRDATYRI